MGVDVAFNWDHFFPLYGDPDGAHYECWTMLGAWAEQTSRIEIGALVTCNSYRNPELLADMARTVDNISDGRLILGIGSGWKEKDYDEYGYEFGTAGSRLDDLAAAMPRITSRLGKLNPAPVRDIPILIGGQGEKKTLRLVAEYAHIWHGFTDASRRTRPRPRCSTGTAPTSAATRPPSSGPRACRRAASRRLLAGAEALVGLGVTLLTIGVNGPDYDLTPRRGAVPLAGRARLRESVERATGRWRHEKLTAAMPKKYGIKEKDLVVSHVVNLVLTGKLRSGDRLDRNEIAEELGLSRVPVQEAVVELEHGGVVSTRYHRGAFVERFDEGVVREHHEIYGVLNGIAVGARGRPHTGPRLVDELAGHARPPCTAPRSRAAFHEHAWRLPQDDQRRVRRAAAAGGDPGVPDVHAAHLLAAYLGSHDELLPFYVAETAAIGDGDPDAARAACAGRAEVMGRIMLTELVRRARARAVRVTERAARCILNEPNPPLTERPDR